MKNTVTLTIEEEGQSIKVILRSDPMPLKDGEVTPSQHLGIIACNAVQSVLNDWSMTDVTKEGVNSQAKETVEAWERSRSVAPDPAS